MPEELHGDAADGEAFLALGKFAVHVSVERFGCGVADPEIGRVGRGGTEAVSLGLHLLQQALVVAAQARPGRGVTPDEHLAVLPCLDRIASHYEDVARGEEFDQFNSMLGLHQYRQEAVGQYLRTGETVLTCGVLCGKPAAYQHQPKQPNRFFHP